MNEAAAKHALVRGRDHRALGAYSVETVGTSLALGISAGAHAKPSLDANEDAGAVVRGARADLLVVADGHFGGEASELAVDHVLDALGDDPPAADLDDARLVELFFEAGLAVQRGTTRAGAPHPNSRTTLALALVTDATVQWASMGDSCVALATHESAARLDVPRSAYLGQRFALAEVAASKKFQGPPSGGSFTGASRSGIAPADANLEAAGPDTRAPAARLCLDKDPTFPTAARLAACTGGLC